MCPSGSERGSGENGYMCTYGWVPHCLPETTTTLLIGYTPIQNGFGVKKN